MITDPVLATQILRNKAVDKLRFMYSFLDVVSLFQACMTTAQQDVQRDRHAAAKCMLCMTSTEEHRRHAGYMLCCLDGWCKSVSLVLCGACMKDMSSYDEAIAGAGAELLVLPDSPKG